MAKMNKRLGLAQAIASAGLMASATSFALELPTQTVQGQLFDNPIAAQAFAVEVIDRDALALLPVNTLTDALEWTAGLDVRQRGGGSSADLSVRGAGYEQTLILVDGIRMNDPQTGHHNFDIPLVLEDIERIEIVRGPGASQYGPNGNGGVINLVTRKSVDTESGREALLQLEAGSKDHDRSLISLGKTEGKWSTFAAASQTTSDAYIKEAELDYTTQQGNARLVYQGDSSSTVVGLGYVDKGFGAEGAYTGQGSYARENTIQRQAYINQTFDFENQSQLALDLNWRQHDDEFYFLSNAPSVHQSEALQSRVRYKLNNSFSVGLEHNQEQLESNRISVDGLAKRNYYSAFTYGQKQFGAVNASVSLAFTEYTSDESFVLPVVGLSLPISDQEIYFNAGQSARLPSMFELYLQQPPSGIGNRDLKTETTDSLELGYRYNYAGITGRAAVFRRFTEDRIDFTRTDSELAANATPIARNLESIDTKGVDFELDATNVSSPVWDRLAMSRP